MMDRLLGADGTFEIVVELNAGDKAVAHAVAWQAMQRANEATAERWMVWQCSDCALEVGTHAADESAELCVTCAPSASLSLGRCMFRLQLRVARHATMAWPFAAGALVPVAAMAEGQSLELTYPVYAGMQWVDVFAEAGGLYVGIHDDAPYFKHLRASATRSESDILWTLEIDYTDLTWPMGRAWCAPPLVLARHQGDWRAGAQRYRSWAESWFRRDPVPRWLCKSSGHNMVSFVYPNGKRTAFAELPALAKATRRLGMTCVHIADWMEEGHDTFYPAYDPDPALGGPEALKAAVESMAAGNTAVSLYFNGRLLDPAGPFGGYAFDWAVKLTPEVRARFSAMWERTQNTNLGGWDPGKVWPKCSSEFNRDGSAAEEWWGRSMPAICPAVPGWRALWLNQVGGVVDAVRPRMIQVDQVCGCWSMPCYDATHPHVSPALAWSHYKAFTWQMRRRVQACNPEIALWTEGVNDLLGLAFDGLQASLGFDSLLAGIGEWDPRIFRVTFPEYVLVSGDLDGLDKRALVWAIVLGCHYHFAFAQPGAVTADVLRWIRFATALRQRYWRQFCSTEVFIPDHTGDAGVRLLAYRTARRLLLVGAPLGRKEEDVERAFQVDVPLPGQPAGIERMDTLLDPPGKAAIKRGHCEIAARGPFAALLKLTR